MMCFHNHGLRSDLVLLTTSLILYSDIFFCSNAVQSSKDHSSLTLYQGTDKYELDAKDCPVGIALTQPERFSCACINGIWAFYDNPCHEPIAIVGGNHHCFQMPTKAIRMAVAVSNPLRAMGEFLTVFDGDMEGIRSKVYRNMRMRLTDADKFVSLNSSWTITSPDGSKSVCLESKNVMFEGLSSAEAATFPDASYCSFSDLSEEMPFIGGIKKGCNSSMVLEPIQCQPMLPNIGDEICLSNQILKDYQDTVLLDSDVNLDIENELSDDTNTHVRPSRALKNLGRFLEKDETSEPVTEKPVEIVEKVGQAYKGEPEWHRRLTASQGNSSAKTSNTTKAPAVSSNQTKTPSTSSNQTKVQKMDVEKAWNSTNIFLTPPPSNSNHLIANHLWMFRRIEIRNSLNITRLVPPEDDMVLQVESGKVKKLLAVHKDIMKRICPLVSSSFFDTVAGTFLGILTKGFRWKEPYLEQTHYLRILTSLSLCKNKAVPMQFAHPTTKCSYKNTEHIALPSTEGNETVFVQLSVPDVFRTKTFEPVIEAVWKIFVTVHSYCFKDFSGQFQDHHKYTTLMMGLFSNKLHDIWVRNNTIGIEYAGILGNIAETMRGLERCATGARMTSDYPFHMNRPTKLSKYLAGNEMKSLSRPKRDAPELVAVLLDNIDDSDPPFSKEITEKEIGSRMKVLSRKKRLTVNSINSENRIGDTIFNGRGICLKKYNDQKMALGAQCRKRSVDSY